MCDPALDLHRLPQQLRQRYAGADELLAEALVTMIGEVVSAPAVTFTSDPKA